MLLFKFSSSYLGIFTNYLSFFVFLMLGARDSPAECGAGSARKAAEENQNKRRSAKQSLCNVPIFVTVTVHEILLIHNQVLKKPICRFWDLNHGGPSGWEPRHGGLDSHY